MSSDFGRAREHWQHSLTLCARLGVPEAGAVRARLTALGDDRPG